MAVEGVERDLKLTRAEQEKERENQAGAELRQPWPLPPNVSEFKSFVFGKFTFRDIAFVFGCEAIPIVIMMAFSLLIPQWLCIVIGFCLGLPLSFLSLKHVFTGELPIEERVKIALKERGATNILNWDKTKKDGEYIGTSTQSFVPDLVFDEDDFVMLPGDKGGFAVIEVSVDDMAQSKNTEMRSTVYGFADMLNRLISSDQCIPIQVMLKAVPKNLGTYIESAVSDYHRIEMSGRPLSAARAMDYTGTLEALDQEVEYHYSYFVVVTYREDAENVGTQSMKSASTIRKEIREKSDPLSKKVARAREMEDEFDIGDDRKAKIKEQSKASEFGRLITRNKLERRVGIVMNALKNLGSTHSEVRPRVLDKHEIAKLIYDCYNEEDKNRIDTVIDEALMQKNTMFARQMYLDFPELFMVKNKEKKSLTRSMLEHGDLKQLASL